MSQKDGNELFIGLVGAVGTDLNKIIKSITVSLKKVNYDSRPIVLSELLSPEDLGITSKPENEYQRIKFLQESGDKFRETMNDGGAVASLAIIDIRDYRSNQKGDPNTTISNQAYILKSLKHKEEVKKLRKIYGKNFWLIAAYSPRNKRLDYLSEIITEKTPSLESKAKQYAEELIERDYHNSTNDDWGQNVRDTFPMADVFVNVVENNFEQKIERFIELVFNNTLRTPSIDEYGMFHAYASAFRSSSLSRQVGASIVSTDGDVISTGTNEVPKYGGGHYVEGDPNDQRELKKGKDSNHVIRIDMLCDVFDRLKQEKWFTSKIQETKTKELVNTALNNKILKEINFMNVTEFGREVHAEMSALIDGSRRTISVKKGTLFCTTFPCHVCAKHIIAAGIKRVIYIEPYPKSLALKLFKDSISVDEDLHENKVSFEPFVGISPVRYMDLFQMSTRKDYDTGLLLDWDPLEALPRYKEVKPYQDDVTRLATSTY